MHSRVLEINSIDRINVHISVGIVFGILKLMWAVVTSHNTNESSSSGSHRKNANKTQLQFVAEQQMEPNKIRKI